VQEGNLQRSIAATFEQHLNSKAVESASPVAEKDTPVPLPPVHLLTATATMSQACGVSRLLLKGHDAPVVKVHFPFDADV
jgi:hypothetical protein